MRSFRVFRRQIYWIVSLLGLGWLPAFGPGSNAASTPPSAGASQKVMQGSGKGFSQRPSGVTAPTTTTIESFSADRYNGGVLIQWRTAIVPDNLGFRLYRVLTGKKTLITPELIAGSALRTAGERVLNGAKPYVWWDNDENGCQSGCKNAQYLLEEIDLSGKSEWHGPIDARLAFGAAPKQTPSRQLAGLGTLDVASKPVQASAATPELSGAVSPFSFVPAGQFAIKIRVNHEGWYRITQQELLAVGLSPNTDPRNLQLYVDGQPQAMLVTGQADGKLDGSDVLEFYGIGSSSPYTDTRVYWLAIGSSPGSRITSTVSPASPVSGGGFPFTVERRDRTTYFSGLLNGDIENFFGAVISSQPVNQSFTVTHLDPSSTAATLDVTLQGVTFVTHQISVSLNGFSLGTLVFGGPNADTESFAVPAAVLQAGVNQVTLTGAGGGSVSLVDNLRLTYSHTCDADNDFLKIPTTGGQHLTLGSFSSNSIRIFDITDPAAVQEVVGQIQPQGGGFAVSLFVPGTGPRTLIGLSNSQIGPARQVLANIPSAWSKTSRGADLLIITIRDFFSSVDQLRVTRQSQGLSVAVVDIEDIYDEFSFGQKTPYAIRDFLSFVRNSWKKGARYAVFVADASLDPKNYLGYGDFDLVPSKLIDTVFMEASSDDWFADFNGDGLAEMSLGRLPVRDGETTERLISKILAYDESIPPDEMLLVADANDAYDFETASAELHDVVPGDVRALDLNRGQMDSADAKAYLLDSISRGMRFVNYVGHGNVNEWAGNLLTNDDAVALTNTEHLPFFLMMTCLNGYFNDPALDSLAEKLLMNPYGGAIAVWTSTGQTTPFGQWAINQEMYRQLFITPNVRIGDAARASKAATIDFDVRLTWLLFGDPTMRIR